MKYMPLALLAVTGAATGGDARAGSGAGKISGTDACIHTDTDTRTGTHGHGHGHGYGY